MRKAEAGVKEGQRLKAQILGTSEEVIVYG